MPHFQNKFSIKELSNLFSSLKNSFSSKYWIIKDAKMLKKYNFYVLQITYI